MPETHAACPECGETSFTWNIEMRAEGYIVVEEDGDRLPIVEQRRDEFYDDTHLGVYCDHCGEHWHLDELDADEDQQTLSQ